MAVKKKTAPKPAKKETKPSALKAIVNAFKKGGKGKDTAPEKTKTAGPKNAKAAPAPASKKVQATKPSAPAKKADKKVDDKELKTKKAVPAPVTKKAEVVQVKVEVKAEAKVEAPKEKKMTPKAAAKAAAAAALQAQIDAACREIACESVATTLGYCRLHYIKNWKRIKRKEIILREKKLNQYIEELVAKYPDKYIEAIRNDLSNEKDFSKVISDLDIDENNDEFEGDTENVEAIVDSIRRDFEDDGDF